MEKYEYSYPVDNYEKQYSELKPNNEFKLDDVNEIVVCINCKSNQFIVGKGYYLTAIKCKNCEWEFVTHSG